MLQLFTFNCIPLAILERGIETGIFLEQERSLVAEIIQKMGLKYGMLFTVFIPVSL